MNSGTRDGTSVPALADFTYCNLHLACFLVTISGLSVEVYRQFGRGEGEVDSCRIRVEIIIAHRRRREDLPKARIRSSAKNLFRSNIEAEAPGRFISSP